MFASWINKIQIQLWVKRLFCWQLFLAEPFKTIHVFVQIYPLLREQHSFFFVFVRFLCDFEWLGVTVFYKRIQKEIHSIDESKISQWEWNIFFHIVWDAFHFPLHFVGQWTLFFTGHRSSILWGFGCNTCLYHGYAQILSPRTDPWPDFCCKCSGRLHFCVFPNLRGSSISAFYLPLSL